MTQEPVDTVSGAPRFGVDLVNAVRYGITCLVTDLIPQT